VAEPAADPPPVDPPLTPVSSCDDGVTVLMLNRPEKKNALSLAARVEPRLPLLAPAVPVAWSGKFPGRP